MPEKIYAVEHVDMDDKSGFYLPKAEWHLGGWCDDEVHEYIRADLVDELIEAAENQRLKEKLDYAKESLGLIAYQGDFSTDIPVEVIANHAERSHQRLKEQLEAATRWREWPQEKPDKYGNYLITYEIPSGHSDSMITIGPKLERFFVSPLGNYETWSHFRDFEPQEFRWRPIPAQGGGE
jgi:hypothetical protein